MLRKLNHCSKRILTLLCLLAVLIQYRSVTDIHVNGQTDRIMSCDRIIFTKVWHNSTSLEMCLVCKLRLLVMVSDAVFIACGNMVTVDCSFDCVCVMLILVLVP